MSLFRFHLEGENIYLITTTKLSLTHKLSRLGNRLRDPEWRQYRGVLLTGKLLGIGLLDLASIFINPDLMGL